MFERGIPYKINTCNITQSPEKFICINPQCQEQRDQYFGCYECLIKKHKQIDQLHFENIIEIATFLSQIQQKQQKKIEILEKLTKDCDSKKKIVQQSSDGENNILNNDTLQQRIEQLFNTYLIQLQNEKESLSLFINYSNQQQSKLLKLYNEDIEQYEKEITEKGFKLQVNVDEIREQCQTVTLQQLNQLKNELQTLQNEFQKQQLLIAQLKNEKLNKKISPFYQALLLFQLPLLFLILIFLFFKEYPNLYYSFFKDVNSELDLIQMNQTNQDFKLESQNQTNYQWLISEILENVRVEEFKNFTLIYENSFVQPFTQKIYDQILIKVFFDNKDKLVCIGAKQKQNLALIGCDLATEVFSQTQNAYSARKSQNGEIYWYWVQSKSFGFSPKKNIVLNNIDEEDPSNELRFSYGTTKNLEDRRIGSKRGQLNTSEYNLVIYLLEENK